MGIFKKILGLQDIEVHGALHVGNFRKRFKESFGTEVKVYKPKADGTLNTGKGSRPASEKVTLASICAKEGSVAGITIKKNKTVGQVEDEFASKMGVGIQIMLPDGKAFAPNDMKLKDVANL